MHKRVLSLTWPVIIANLSLPLAGAVDTAVVGHLPDPVYIGAVALGALVFSSLFWLVGFLRMGTTGFVAQSVGAGDLAQVTATFLRGLAIASVLGGVMIVFQVPIGSVVFWFFDASPEVEMFALDYYGVRIWSVIFMMFNLVVLGVLFGLQRMRTALLLQLLLNGMNIVLDLIFVLGFGWAVLGVAAATMISEIVTAVVGLAVCANILGVNLPIPRELHIFDRQKLIELTKVNVNIMIRTLCLEVVLIYFMWKSSSSGDVILAANAILLHLLHFLAFGLDGFAHAAEALAGAAYGAKDRVRLRNTVSVALIWSVVVAVFFCVVYWIGGNFIIALLTGIEEVRQGADKYLFWLVIAPIFCVWPFLYDGVYIGMTRTVEMRNFMIISMLVFFLVAYFTTRAFDNHGLWLALMVFMVVRGLTLGLWFRRIEVSVGQVK
ncbi:MAG: MATE family efflux transporter [Acidiferrobacterales bacterium]|nr:MATE family efflux transporter [Acidiferrobacterales bacterium]